MNEEKATGIVLQSVDFRDNDRIITVFSEEYGLMKFMVHGGNGGRKGLQALTTPLTIGEFIFRQRRGELFTMREGKVLDTHEDLRKKWKPLEAACQCLQTILKSQWPEKPAPRLYQLLVTYLKVLPKAKDPRVFSSSFKLKTLVHEGLFFPSEGCSQCQRPAEDLFVADGNSFCGDHKPSWAIRFSGDEKDLLLCLSLTRSTQALSALPLDREFFEKVEELFMASMG